MRRARVYSEDVIFRAILKEWRLERGVTQAELARRLSQPQSYVSKYETGERRLDFAETAVICDALGGGIAEFAASFAERCSGRGKRRGRSH